MEHLIIKFPIAFVVGLMFLITGSLCIAVSGGNTLMENNRPLGIADAFFFFGLGLVSFSVVVI